jgi:hypothetical protein
MRRRAAMSCWNVGACFPFLPLDKLCVLVEFFSLLTSSGVVVMSGHDNARINEAILDFPPPPPTDINMFQIFSFLLSSHPISSTQNCFIFLFCLFFVAMCGGGLKHSIIY